MLCDDPNVLEAAIKKFSIPVDNYWFMPAYKAGRWDGKVRFINYDGTFYNGIFHRVLKYVKNDDIYELEIDPKYINNNVAETLKQDFFQVTEETLNSNMVPYAHQFRGALKCLYFGRGICEHVTSSGKSLTISLVVNYLYQKNKENKILILVPKLDLVEQFVENLATYGIDSTLIGKYCGYQKDTTQPFIVSTWQSMHKQKELLKEFKVLIVDECLHPDTLITMGDGTTKPIKNVIVGDIVKTVNESTKNIENKPILKLHSNISKNNQMYEITLEDGSVIKITGNHKIMLVNGNWKKVEELCVDDEIKEI